MSTPYYVHVSNIAPTTTQVQLRDFFSIQSLDHKAEENTATIYFEKSNAAKTALMLNGGTLDGSHLEVTSDAVHEDDPHQGDNGPHIEQSDKPRAGIAAEYLAKGYELSDSILHRAIEIDQKQGISQKFLRYFHTLDTTLGARTLGPNQTITGKLTASIEAATQQAKAVDEQRGISKIAHDYYQNALATPFGQKVKDFYTTTTKQALDIHEEARRLAALHKSEEVPADKPVAQA
ncbi:hypothetical protein ONZ45_g11248 [Pleurotus djamor]|nr:hypothetical protein ONZ45_g11248 [Pleurotus djamor]